MFAAVAIFAAASCQKEMANEPLENNSGEQYTFSATILETKTVLAEGNKVNWSGAPRGNHVGPTRKSRGSIREGKKYLKMLALK